MRPSARIAEAGSTRPQSLPPTSQGGRCGTGRLPETPSFKAKTTLSILLFSLGLYSIYMTQSPHLQNGLDNSFSFFLFQRRGEKGV